MQEMMSEQSIHMPSQSAEVGGDEDVNVDDVTMSTVPEYPASQDNAPKHKPRFAEFACSVGEVSDLASHSRCTC
jgi:hypothetical protein